MAVSAPALLVGLILGLIQAITQIQEQTLVYAPKIAAIFVAILVFLPARAALMKTFTDHIAARIAAM